MKPKASLCHFLLTAAGSFLAILPNASAADYWWNQNGTASGWGSGGTWSTSSTVFSTTDSDTASAGAATTGTADTLNIGTSAVGFAGGTLTLSGNQSIGSIITGSANSTSFVDITSQNLIFAASGTITNNSSQSLFINSTISNSGAGTRLDLNANGGAITMSTVTNTYTGITYINSGSVFTNNVGSLGASGTDANRTVVASGARLVFNNSGRTYTERFEIAGAGVGGTTGALSNGQTTTNLNGLISLSAAATIHNSNGTLTIGSAAATGGISLGSNALTFNASGGTITVGNTGITGESGSVVKSGASTLNLNVASSYGGGTTVSAGTLNIGAAVSGSDSAIGSTSGTLTVNGGTLNMAGNNVTVGNLTGTGGVISGTSGTRTLTIGQGNTGGGDYQGQINNGSGGTTAVTKTGSGTIALSGANGYTGATTVSAGTLLVNGSTASGSAVTVGTGGTLGGSGTVGGAVTVNGALKPGNSTGLLSVGSLALNASSSTTLEITGTNRGAVSDGYDALGVNTGGSIALGGALSFMFGNLSAFAANTDFDLFSFTTTSTGDFASVTSTGFYEGTWSKSGDIWSLIDEGQTLSFSEVTGNLVVIPEPRAALLGAIGLIALLRRRR